MTDGARSKLYLALLVFPLGGALVGLRLATGRWELEASSLGASVGAVKGGAAGLVIALIAGGLIALATRDRGGAPPAP